MQGIVLDATRVVQTGQSVGSIADALTGEIATMHTTLADIQAGWQSEEAAPRFAARMQDYLDQAALMKNALVSHGAGLTLAGNTFGQVETELATGYGVVPV